MVLGFGQHLQYVELLLALSSEITPGWVCGTLYGVGESNFVAYLVRPLSIVLLLPLL